MFARPIYFENSPTKVYGYAWPRPKQIETRVAEGPASVRRKFVGFEKVFLHEPEWRQHTPRIGFENLRLREGA